MKAYSVIFLLICAILSCTSQENTSDDNSTETTESFTTQPIELETNAPPIVGEIEVSQALIQEPEANNAIDGELRPTKKPKRPNPNKRPWNMGKRPQHHHHAQSGPPPLTVSWPYYPAPPQIPYPMAYPSFPPMYYPMPMYSPYFFSPQMCNQRKPSENVSPPNIDRMDPSDSSDSEMETIPHGFLKIANFWDHEMKFGNKTSGNKNGTAESKPPKRFHIFWDHEMKFGNKTAGNKNGTVESKPPKRFPIKEWIKNKFDEKNYNSNENP